LRDPDNFWHLFHLDSIRISIMRLDYSEFVVNIHPSDRLIDHLVNMLECHESPGNSYSEDLELQQDIDVMKCCGYGRRQRRKCLPKKQREAQNRKR
jgi:hypothetical protein